MAAEPAGDAVAVASSSNDGTIQQAEPNAILVKSEKKDDKKRKRR